MADETHGIEIEIDSRPAESGKQRVVRSLEDIKRKANEIGKAGADAGKQFSDGLGQGAATAAGRATRSMEDIRSKARQAGEDIGRGSSGFTAWSRGADQMAKVAGTQLDQTGARALRVGQQIASGAGSFKSWSQQTTHIQRVAGVLDTVALAARSGSQQIAAGAGSFKLWSQEASRVTAAGKSLDDVKRKSREAFDQMQRGASASAAAFRSQTTAINQTLAAAARLQPSFAAIEASANRVRRAEPFRGFQTSARSVLPDLLNLRNVLLSFGAIGLAKYVVNTEASFRGFDQALRIITGNQADASKEMAFARDTAETLGLRIKDLTGSYIGLLAAARGTNLEGEKSQAVFSAITKAGVAYGLSNDNIRGALLAVQQMMSKGQVQAEELRGQLGERLPGAFQVAARAMGVTTAQLSKMLEMGQVVSADFLPKFAAQLNKEIPDGAKSAYAGFNAFLDQLDRATRVLANSGLFEGLAAGAKGLGNALQGLASDGSLAAFGSAIGGVIQFLGQNIDLLKTAAIAYGVFFAAIKVGAIYAYVAQLVALNMALGASTVATALFGAAVKGLQVALAFMLSPLVLVTAAITGLIIAFMSMNSSGQATQALLDGVGKQAHSASLSLEEATDRAIKGASSIGSVGTESNGAVAGIDNFAGAVGRAAQQLYALAKARQVAALSSLIKQRNEAAVTFNQLRAQTSVGTEERRQAINKSVSDAPGIKKVGAIWRGAGAMIGVAGDNASKALGFGPDEQKLRTGAAIAQASVKLLDQAITTTRGSLEQFVTAQDKAAVSATKVVKPNRAIANAMAQVQGATTAADKAQAGLALTRAQASADLKAGTITQEQYSQRVGEAIQAVHSLRDATRGHSQSLAEQRKAAAAAAKVLAESERNATKRQGVTDRYDVQPRFLDQVDKDQGALDKMVGEWIKVGDAVVKYTEAMRAADSVQIQLAKNKPFGDLMQDMQTELAIQTMILNGRELEAIAIQKKVDYERSYGKMLPAQYQDLLAHVAAQDQISRALEDQRRIASMYAATVGEIQDSFEQFLTDAMTNPFKATMNFAKSIIGSLKKLVIKEISEGVFGGIGREIEDMVTGKGGVQAATKELVESTATATNSTYTLADTMVDAARIIRDAANMSASQITGVSSGGSAGGTTENENGDIVVTARSPSAGGAAQQTNYRQQMIERVVGRVGGGLTKLWNSMPKGMQSVLKSVGGTIEGGLKKIGITLPKGIEGISGAISKGMKGAGEGMFASSIVNSLGLKQSKTGAAIGGAVGSFLPIPGGGFIGGLVGGTLGGLFKKKKPMETGTVSISGSDEMGAMAGTAAGNNTGAKAAATGSGKSVQSGLTQIAQSLGGLVGAFGGLTIGKYGESYKVNTTGSTELKNGKAGVVDFDEDEGAAIAFAIKTAIQRGAIQGISEASKRVLQSGSDVDASVAAATTYEELLRQAARLRDPIRGAFDEIKRGMDMTIQQLKAAGYTTEEIAQVQSVFAAQQKQALEEMTSGYKSFLADITKGPDSGLTISAQFTNAQTDFGVAKAGLATGETSQDEFTEAGQKLFDLALQTYGRATPEFESVKADLVAATEDALRQVEAASAETGVITAIQATADAAASQRAETNTYLAQIAASVGGTGTAPANEPDSGAGYYIGGGRKGDYLKVANY